MTLSGLQISFTEIINTSWIRGGKKVCEADVPLGMETKPVPARSSLGRQPLPGEPVVFKGSPPGTPTRPTRLSQ